MQRKDDVMTLSRKTRQEMHDNALIDTAVSMCFLAAGLVLNGEFGFGEKRMERFSKEFTQTIIDYRNRYGEVALEALKKHAKQKGIEVNWK